MNNKIDEQEFFYGDSSLFENAQKQTQLAYFWS